VYQNELPSGLETPWSALPPDVKIADRSMAIPLQPTDAITIFPPPMNFTYFGTFAVPWSQSLTPGQFVYYTDTDTLDSSVGDLGVVQDCLLFSGSIAGSGIVAPSVCQVGDTCPRSGQAANFSITARYPTGATTLSGQVQFQTGRLAFTSTRLDWLFVHGSKAIMQGAGRINRHGGYTFLVSTIDEPQGDRFRIKIWETATGTVVYDTQHGSTMNTDVLADPTSLVTQGQVTH
jgi:hypothetical protein